jgi:intein/homing endonuclease/glycosyltransferase involved in cell wall biosynthesis
VPSDRKLRILMIPTLNSGVMFYRMMNFARASWKSGGAEFDVVWYQKDLQTIHPWQLDLKKPEHYYRIMAELWDRVKHADAIVVQMVQSSNGLAMVHAIKDAIKEKGWHIPVLAEIDDDMLNTPAYNPAAYAYNPGEPLREIAVSQFKASDGIIVTTPHLKEVYEHLNPNVHIIPNAIDFHVWDKANSQRKKRSGVRIGWAGGANHDADFKGFDTIIKNITSRHKDVKFVFVHGVPRHLRDLPGVEFHRDFFRIDKYPQKMNNLDIDIGIAPLVDNGFNRGKCITGDSWVLTSEGIKRIDNVSEFRGVDQFLPVKGESFEAFYYGGVKDCVRIKTSMGYEIAGTLTHRVKKPDGEWIKLGDIKRGDRVMMSSYEFPKVDYKRFKFPLWITKNTRYESFDANSDMLPEITINEKWGRLLGYILGDGHLSRTTQVRVSGSDEYSDVMEDVEGLFRSMGLHPNRSRKKYKDGNVLIETQAFDVYAASNHFLKFLNHIGFSGRANGKNFCVPDVILQSPKPVIKEFLSALFETDGTVCTKNSRMAFTSKSLDLARGVQFLLLGFGIHSRIKAKLNKQYNRYYYTVHLGREALDVFASEIGFISAKKTSRLMAVVTKPHSNRYKKFDWSDSVETISAPFQADVFDVSVPVTHEYKSNGFVSHNSNLKWIENLAMSIQTVASNVGHYKQTVRDGIDGLLADTPEEFEAHLERLITNKKWRKEMGRAAYARVYEDFNAAKVAAAYTEAIDAAIAQKIKQEKKEWTEVH